GSPPPMDRARVTSDFEAIVARCLAKDPAGRFQGVTQLEAALAPFVRASRPIAGASFLSTGGIVRRSRRWMWVAGVAALAIAGGSGFRSAVLGDSVAAAVHREVPRSEGSPQQTARVLPPTAPAPVSPAPASTQPSPAVQRGDLVPSHPRPAL